MAGLFLKLLILLYRRDGRVAEGARLESVYTGNPQLSSIINRLAALLSPPVTLSVLPLEVNHTIVCAAWAIWFE